MAETPDIPPEILASIERLERAVDRATAGEQDGLDATVRAEGERLVRTLHSILRMTRMHSLDNQAFHRPLTELKDTVGSLLDLTGAVRIVAVEEQVYVNDVRVRFEDRADVGRELARELARQGVGGITLHDRLNGVQLRALIDGFAAAPDEVAPRAALMERLSGKPLGSVEILGEFRFKVSDEVEHQRGTRDLVELNSRSATAIQQCWDNLGAQRLPNAAPIRRLVAEMIQANEDAALLTSDPPGATPYTAHTLRVAHVCLMLGRALGLTADVLQDLGVTAMFHDVGYAAREGRGSRDDGTEGFAPPFERHGTAGVRLMLRQRGFHEGKIRRALATLEHHRDFNDGKGTPSLFGRILRIAEDFDNLVRVRGGNFAPAEALARMAGWSGIRYDPVLLQLLVNTLGKYPPGTVMELEDGRLVRSKSTVRYPAAFDTPLCELLRYPDGREPDTPVIIDLSKQGKVRRVMRAVRQG